MILNSFFSEFLKYGLKNVNPPEMSSDPLSGATS